MNNNANNSYMLNLKNENWKIKNEEYLLQVEKFLDLADGIKDEELKKSIIVQMLKCDEALTNAAEKEINKNNI